MARSCTKVHARKDITAKYFGSVLLLAVAETVLKCGPIP